jgi:hypothetical protein
MAVTREVEEESGVLATAQMSELIVEFQIRVQGL